MLIITFAQNCADVEASLVRLTLTPKAIKLFQLTLTQEAGFKEVAGNAGTFAVQLQRAQLCDVGRSRSLARKLKVTNWRCRPDELH